MGIMEFANDLFNKGKELASDVAQQAGDLASTAGVKAKLADKGLERDRLMKELGLAVYDAVKGDEALVAANAELFGKIEANAAARQKLEDELAAIERNANERRAGESDPVQPQGAAEPDYSTGYRSATVGATQK